MVMVTIAGDSVEKDNPSMDTLKSDLENDRIGSSYARILAPKQQLATSLSPRKVNQRPETYSLTNYPNPFNPATLNQLVIPVDAKVTVSVYSTLGQPVA